MGGLCRILTDVDCFISNAEEFWKRKGSRSPLDHIIIVKIAVDSGICTVPTEHCIFRQTLP